jgi:hypothetical protein
MRNLPRTVRFGLIAVITTIAVLVIRALDSATPTPTPTTCQEITNPRNEKFVLEIGGPGNSKYVEFQTPHDANQRHFNDVLNAIETKKRGQYCIRFLGDGPNAQPEDPYNPHHTHATIKTDKVTISEVAKNGPVGESAANDPNVTYRVQSNNADDIQQILGTLK